MKTKIILLIVFVITISCGKTVTQSSRVVEDFNANWKFKLGVTDDAFAVNYNDENWEELNVPHDWSIETGYNKEKGAASTGFVEGGIGWYRKSFVVSSEDKEKNISIVFDGVYNNSTVWINGNLLGYRPNGYSTFSYNLNNYLKFDGSQNVISVKVDRTAFIDSRWYTGSGIYRKVQLVKTNKLHIAQWGVQISTPIVTDSQAEVLVKTTVEDLGANKAENVKINYSVISPSGEVVLQKESTLAEKDNLINNEKLAVENPKLWSVNEPNLYTLKVQLFEGDILKDETTNTFGIRTFNFDAQKGFSLNGVSMKLKGVNLHHDAGAVGTAVPKEIWQYRIDKLKSIGVNAIRMAHNPHSVELMEVCDENGILVMAEAFDEWYVPKAKSMVYLGDNAASEVDSKAYPVHFNEWAERDLKDLILRDYNHPSVIMWSIGNEIEWTFPHYSKTFNDVNGKTGAQGYIVTPIYDSLKVKEALLKNIEGEEPLAATAKKLVKWAKEVDTTRPITCGSVLPSIGMASGYGTAVDVFGFNYRAADYDAAHKEYPNLKIVGSENWGDYNEWKSINERDFVAGIFTWTGFAYLGEAGPWPRKGLEISFFDYAGLKTARGHFFECLWVEKPKVYMVTTPANESEFSFSEKDGWKFEMQLTPPPVWNMLRKWEWYKTYPKWNYAENESIIVQTYTNCEEAELFLNGSSLGKQQRADFGEDNIIKWLVPYKTGELKVVGYNNGVKADEYVLKSQNKAATITLSSNKKAMKANGYDVTVFEIEIKDENGALITDVEEEITFNLEGEGINIGVDNGWEMNVQHHKTNKIITHLGKAVLFVQSTKKSGIIKVQAITPNLKSNSLEVHSK